MKYITTVLLIICTSLTLYAQGTTVLVAQFDYTKNPSSTWMPTYRNSFAHDSQNPFIVKPSIRVSWRYDANGNETYFSSQVRYEGDTPMIIVNEAELVQSNIRQRVFEYRRSATEADSTIFYQSDSGGPFYRSRRILNTYGTQFNTSFAQSINNMGVVTSTQIDTTFFITADSTHQVGYVDGTFVVFQATRFIQTSDSIYSHNKVRNSPNPVGFDPSTFTAFTSESSLVRYLPSNDQNFISRSRTVTAADNGDDWTVITRITIETNGNVVKRTQSGDFNSAPSYINEEYRYLNPVTSRADSIKSYNIDVLTLDAQINRFTKRYADVRPMVDSVVTTQFVGGNIGQMSAVVETYDVAYPTSVAGFTLPTSLPDAYPDQPMSIELAQNYPNPFNPVTMIGFSIPESAHVTLQVFDTLGRHVGTLSDGLLSAGTHQVRFDARNLASGIYLYRLQAGGMVLTRSMTLVR